MTVFDELQRDLRALFQRYEQRAIVVVFAREVDADSHIGGRLMTYENHTNGMAILSAPETIVDIMRRAASCRRAMDGGSN